jgi:protein Mpv17
MQHAITGRVLKLWRAYEVQLKKRPIPMQMSTSAVLWAVGDCLAQKVAEQRPKIDTHRVAMTAGFGASFLGPVGHYWYIML